MAPKSLLEHNPHLRNAQEYQRALRASVLSSIAIEGDKAPRSKLRGINTALQTAGYRQPSLQAAGNLPEEIKKAAERALTPKRNKQSAKAR